MKQILLFVSAFLYVIVANGQANSHFWSLKGNGNTNTSSKLGTTNGVDLRLITNNLERLRVTTSGNVGIGTSTPQQKLEVNGNINLAGGSSLYVDNIRVMHSFSQSFFAGP